MRMYLNFTPAAETDSALYSTNSTEIVSGGLLTCMCPVGGFGRLCPVFRRPWTCLAVLAPATYVRRDSVSATSISGEIFRTSVRMPGAPRTKRGRGMRAEPVLLRLWEALTDHGKWFFS